MTIKRLTKDDIRKDSGTFNPVGHVVLAFADDAVAARAAQTLTAQGFAAQDILSYTSPEVLNRLREMVQTASEAAGFGYEITLMRRYLKLAEGGAGWLIVYAPVDDAADKVAEVAKELQALTAVRYHRLANEDLV
jgi:hypothetical protein